VFHVCFLSSLSSGGVCRSSIASDFRSWLNRQKEKKVERSFDPADTILGEQSSGAQSRANPSSSSPSASRGSADDDCATAHFYEPPGDHAVPQNSLAADLSAWFSGERKHPPFLEQFVKAPHASGSTQRESGGISRGDCGSDAPPQAAACPACERANPAEGSSCELCEARALSTRCSHCGETLPLAEAENHFCAAAAEGKSNMQSRDDNNEAGGKSDSVVSRNDNEGAVLGSVGEKDAEEGVAKGGSSGDIAGGRAAAKVGLGDDSTASGGGGGGGALEEFPCLVGETECSSQSNAEEAEDAAAADKFLFWGFPANGGEQGDEHQSFIDRIKASWATVNRPSKRAQPFDRGALPEPVPAAGGAAAADVAASGGGGDGSGGGGSGGSSSGDGSSLRSNDSRPETWAPPGFTRVSSSRSNLNDFEKAEGGCIICCCDRPVYPACFVPCGHASMCYGCALDSAISLSGTCPLCRTRASAIVTYEALELLELPKSELAGLQATRRGAGGAIILPEKGAKDGSAAELTTTTAESGDENEHVLCWVARVTGPTGALLDSLTAEDIARTEEH